jgi:hypothetical protein
MTSKYRGVRRNPRLGASKKWEARIKVNYKMKSLGYFETEERASQEHERARREIGRA